MNEIDVQPELVAATLSPAEGSSNIDKAKVIGLEPDAFIDNKDLNENYESAKAQQITTPPIARKLAQSRSVASVMKEEVPAWNDIDKVMRGVGDTISGVVPDFAINHNDQRQISELNYKEMQNGGKLSFEDNYKLRRLEGRVRRYQQANPGMAEGSTAGEFAQGAGEAIVGTVLDMGLSIYDNPKLASATIGVPAAVGGLATIEAFGVGAIPAAIAAYAAPTGGRLIQATDQYTKIAGDVYGELKKATDANGVPLNIPLNTIQTYAKGAALAGSVFEFISFGVILGEVPVFKKAAKKALTKIGIEAAQEAAGKKFVASTAQRSVGQIIGTLAKVSAAEGGEEGFQELTQQVFTAGGLKFDKLTGKGDITAGITDIWGQYKTSAETLMREGKLTGKAREVAIALGIGAAAGPAMHVGLDVASKAAVKVGEVATERRKVRAEALRTRMQTDLDNRIVSRVSDMQTPQPGMPRVYKGVQGQQAKVVIEELVKMTGNTQLQKMQEAEANQLVADIAHDAGVPFAWLDPDDARAFATDPKKAADFKKLLSTSAQENMSKDAQVKVVTAQMLDFVRKYPETSGMFNFTPEAMTANEHIRKTEELKAKQDATLKNFTSDNAAAPTVTPESDFADQVVAAKEKEVKDINILPTATQEEITNSFTSREQAEAYWDKLDVEESKLLGDNSEQLILSDEFKGINNQDKEQLPLTDEQVVQEAEKLRDFFKLENQQIFTEPRLLDEYVDSLGFIKSGKDTININETLKDSVNNAQTKEVDLINGKKIKISPKIKNDGDGDYIQIFAIDTDTDEEIAKMSLYTEGLSDKYLAPASIRSIAPISYPGAMLELFKYTREYIGQVQPSVHLTKRGENFTNKTLKRQSKIELAPYIDLVKSQQQPIKSERLQQIRDTKTKVETAVASLPSEVDGVIKLQNDVITNEDTYGPQRYNEQAVIPDEVKAVMKPEEVQAIEGMAQEANNQYTNSILDAAEREWLGVVNAQERIALTVQKEIELENTQNDPNINMVENFLNSKKLDPLARELLGATKSKKVPGFAINPESLSPGELAQYGENPKLKERGVFAKKGMNVDDVVKLLGAKDRADLLKVLSETPTRQEAVDANLESKVANITNMVASSTDFNDTAIGKALNDKATAIKNALEYYKNGDWSGFKKAIKAVVLPMPKVQDIRARAEKNIKQTKISDLNVSQYKKGEMRSRRKAANSVLNGDLQQAFNHKVNELENIEASRATHKAQGEVNKRTTKVAKFFTPEVRAVLEAAGPKYVAAIEDIMSMFNLSPYVKENTNQEAYNKLAEDMANTGQGDIALPEHVVADFDPRLGWDSMTVEQYITVVDLMDNVLALAKFKNRTIQTYTNDMAGSMVSLLEEAAQRNLADHPDRDETRSEQEKPNSVKQKVDQHLGEMEALITNTNFAVQHLDQGKTDGFWNKLIVERIKGIGAFKGVWGTEAKAKMYLDVRKQFSEGIKKYGKLKFANLGAARIDVRQFRGIPGLYNGKMSKLDLVVMSTYMGNQGNIDRVSNFNISEEIMWDVMNEHLTTDEMDIAQNLWDIYGAMEERVVALEKLDGEDVELIKSKPFKFKGKEYRGGYAPIQFVTTNHEGLLGKIKNQIGDMFKKEEEGYAANNAARGMTTKGYTKKRTGSDQRISLDVRTIALGLDEVITDLTMRVPVRDVYKLLTNRKISKEIMNVIGKARYNAMKDGIASLTTSETSRRLNGQIQGEATLDNFFSQLESAEAVTALAVNVGSLMMQGLSVPVALENMGGISATKHVLTSVAKLSAPWNWHKIPKNYAFADSINPTIGNAKENIEAKNIAGIMDLLPTRRVWGGKPVNMLALVREGFINKAMSAFAFADVLIKVPITLAAYEQYMKGEAPNQDGYSFWKMTDDEKHDAAVSYAQKISESSLTHSDEFNKANIQKSTLGKRFARYFNDLRNQLNSTVMSSRQLKWNLNEGKRLALEGDIEGSAKAYHSLSDKALSMAVMSLAMGAYEAMFRGFGADDDDEAFSPENVAYGALRSRFFGAAPLARELTFALETGQAPGIPVTRALGNIASGVESLGVILNNYTGLLDDTEMDKELSDKQLKGALSTVSYALGGLPVNGPWKLVKAATVEDAKNVGPEKLALSIVGYFIDRAQRFIEKYKDDSEMKHITEAVQKDLNTVMVMSNTKYEVSDIDLAAFRNAENPKGNWDSTNSNSTAFGNYQITEGTWKGAWQDGEFLPGLVQRAPKSLMLTEDGLYQKDGKQVERAIRWLISDNVRILQNNGIEPSLANIYGAHHFGANGWSKVVNADDSTPISKVLSSNAIRSNPWLQKISTAGEAKEWIRQYITKAKYKALRDASRTSVANNT